MLVYNYDSKGIYTHSEECPLDPLENKLHPETGPHYQYPANSTIVAPPAHSDAQQTRWTGQEWLLEDKPIPEPPLENYLIDLDFRLSLIELGVI